jgi:hypothetical protein
MALIKIRTVELRLNAETESGIRNFRHCFEVAFGREVMSVNRLYFDQYELCQAKNNLLDEINEDFLSDHPSNKEEIVDFFNSMRQVGFDLIDDTSTKVTQRIYEHLKSGVTLRSLGSGIPPTPDELDNYAAHKGAELLSHITANEFEITEDSEDFEKLQEYSLLISIAIVTFFRQGYNVSGPSIHAACISGVGALMLWALVK